MRNEPDYGVRPCCVPSCTRTVPRNRRLDVCRECGIEIALEHLADAGSRDELTRQLRREKEDRAEVRRSALAERSLVYYVRLDAERIKIGFTSNLQRRLSDFHASHEALLAVEPGGRDVETKRHERFAAYRIGRREEFSPSVPLMNWIAFTRDIYGLPRWAALPDTQAITRRSQ